MSPPPLRFAFGVHVHQPIGNFDSVFRQHVEDVYLPFLRSLEERELFPFTLHLSGPLLEWLEARDGRALDRIGALVADGRVELLASGLYEPVLAALPRADRTGQVEGMQALLRRLFGVEAGGLWLTERVWEPDLASDLARAGVRFAIVDDHHFLAAGFERRALHRPYCAEHDGRRLALFPIDERLRYLVPFRPPEDLAAYLRGLRREGHALAVLADDGEKFGGWPGTADWLYEQGWLASFFDTMDDLRHGGEVEMSTFARALETVPSGGPVHLPTASYREMEAWALPTEAGLRLRDLQAELGPRTEGAEGALVRGSHWKNFLVKYRESNRMHQRALALSELCRSRGDPAEARRAVARAQCNDAYWHGVFGGLYMKHLRDAVWANLAEAEGLLRRSEDLHIEPRDFDADGEPELWVHSPAFSALVTPALGGMIEEYTAFGLRTNFANTLTRRREVYHFPPRDPVTREADGDGTPSIHELEAGLGTGELPPVDPHVRGLCVEWLTDSAGPERPSSRPLRSWATERLVVHGCFVEDGMARITLRSEDEAFEKAYAFRRDGSFEVAYRWETKLETSAQDFVVELSCGTLPVLEADGASGRDEEPIVTVSRTEDGLSESEQGTCVTLRWPASVGQALIRLRPDPAAAAEGS